MNHIIRIIFAILLIFSSTIYSQDDNQRSFVENLTKAIKSKDKAAFYAFVCYDGMDEAWKQMGLKGYDYIFVQAEAGRDFTITIEAPDPEKIKPRPFKDGQIAPNLTVTSVCVINWADTEKDKNKSSLNLGQKDGKTLISVYVPKK